MAASPDSKSNLTARQPHRRRFNKTERAAMYWVAGERCEHCGAPLADSFHADHDVPYSKGGDTDVTNGRALCATCNLKKGAR